MSKKLEDEFRKLIESNYEAAQNRVRLERVEASVSNVVSFPSASNSAWRRNCLRFKAIGLLGVMVPSLILIWGSDHLLQSNTFAFLCLFTGMVLGACFSKLVDNMEKELGLWRLKFCGWSTLFPKFEWRFLSPHEYKTLRS